MSPHTAEGWREVSTRASGALTRFWPGQPHTNNTPDPPQNAGTRFTRWAFLPADVFESTDKVVVRIEAPGMRREDFHVALHGDVLTVSGVGARLNLLSMRGDSYPA